MKACLLTLLTTFIFSTSFSQTYLDSLHYKLIEAKPNDSYYILYDITSWYYHKGISDSVKFYGEKLIKVSEKLKNDSFKISSYKLIANYYYLQSDFSNAIDLLFNGIEIAESNNNPNLQELIISLYNNVGWNYFQLNHKEKALIYFKIGEDLLKQKNVPIMEAFVFDNLGETYMSLDSLNLAQTYLNKAEEISRNLTHRDADYIRAGIYIAQGKLNSPQNSEQAIYYFKKALSFCLANEDYKHLATANYEYAHYYFEKGMNDSSIKYANYSLIISIQKHYKNIVIDNSTLFQKIYEASGNLKKAYFFSKLKDIYKDSIAVLQKNSQLLSMKFREELQKNKKEEANRTHNKYIGYVAITITLLTASLIFIILIRSIIISSDNLTKIGLVSLLITFEFINLLIHPILEHHVNSQPVMLIILVGIAYILIPIHHFLEKIVRGKVYEMHRKIRMDKCQKIIEKERSKHKTS